VRVVDVLLL
jgi:hypothetical protein